MADFIFDRWYRDTDRNIWKVESMIRTVNGNRVFAVSSFDSWRNGRIPKNIAVIDGSQSNIGLIGLQDGTTAKIDADEPIPEEIIFEYIGYPRLANRYTDDGYYE